MLDVLKITYSNKMQTNCLIGKQHLKKVRIKKVIKVSLLSVKILTDLKKVPE